MTREEAIAIIRKEYLCVDRDCDIDRSCGKCDLMIPSKEPILEAYKVAIEALEQKPYFWEKCPYYEPDIMFDGKDEYDMGKCTYKQEPKTGHWISHYDEDAKEGWYECDRCHTERAFNTDYCPDCGAYMGDDK